MKTMEFKKENRAMRWVDEHGFRFKKLEYSPKGKNYVYIHPKEGVLLINANKDFCSIRGYNWDELKNKGVIE